MFSKRSSQVIILISLIFAIIFFLFPLLNILAMAFKVNNEFSLNNFSLLFQDQRTIEAIKNTFIISIFTTILSSIVGLLISFFTIYSNIRFKSLIEKLVLIPLIIPSYVFTMAYTTLFSRRSNITGVLELLNLPQINMYSHGGIIFILTIVSTPIVYLMYSNGLKLISRNQEYASISSGHSLLRTIFSVNLKIILPIILTGLVIVFLNVIDNFSVPSTLGTPSGITLVTTYIYQNIIGFGDSNIAYSSTMSFVLIIFTMFALYLQRRFTNDKKKVNAHSEDNLIRFKFSKYKTLISVLVVLPLVIINLVPLIYVVFKSFIGSTGFTFNNYLELFKNSNVLQSILTSFTLAMSTCLILLLVMSILAYVKLRNKSKWLKYVENVISLPNSVPGIVLGLSMIYFFGGNHFIYNTIFILLISYIIRFSIVQYKGSVNGFSLLNKSLENTALLNGGSRIRFLFEILIPLLKRYVLPTTFIIFFGCLTELTLSSVLVAAGSKTIGTTIFSFSQSGEHTLSLTFNALLLIIVVVFYSVYLIWRKNGFNSRKY